MAISIGIPFFNAEEYLLDAIRSVFSQTYQDWELILVDDGSTDQSLEIARSIKDPRVRVISDGKNRRLPYRLNQITREARFDFVARMDADDLMSPTRLAKQIQILQQHPEVDLVTTGMCSLSNKNIPLGVRIAGSNNEVSGKNILLNRSGIIHAAILGRKSWFLRNQYDESLLFTEDYELWLRAYSKNDFNIWVIKEPLYYYREEGNVTAHKLLRTYHSHRILFKTYGSLGFNIIGASFLRVLSYFKSFIVFTESNSQI